MDKPIYEANYDVEDVMSDGLYKEVGQRSKTVIEITNEEKERAEARYRELVDKLLLLPQRKVDRAEENLQRVMSACDNIARRYFGSIRVIISEEYHTAKVVIRLSSAMLYIENLDFVREFFGAIERVQMELKEGMTELSFYVRYFDGDSPSYQALIIMNREIE